MEAQKAHHAVARMARLLKVSRSGFYAWRRRRLEPSEAVVRRAGLDEEVRKAHAASHGTYGAPRVVRELAAQGICADRKTVAASMRRQGLEGISPRRFRPVAPVGEVCAHTIPDLVRRRWDTGELDAVWISDITYLPTDEGWVYLCAVRDGCSRRVLGWSMAAVQDSNLVERALRMARTLRGEIGGQIVFHADRGAQYTSAQLHAAAQSLGVLRSVGRTGVCWDNAMQESFWSTLKSEFYVRKRWRTRAEAMAATGEWIEAFYNRRRLHSSLDYLSPVDFEHNKRLDQRQPAQAA